MAGAEHLGLAHIASHLRSCGVPVTLLNFQLPAFFNAWDGLLDERASYAPTALAAEILESAPDIVGFCVTAMTLRPALEIAGSIKAARPGCRVGLGGPHAILCADELFRTQPFIDFIGLGDGERAMEHLVRSVSDGTWPHPIPAMLVRGVSEDTGSDAAAEVVRTIEDLPAPARDDLLFMAARAPVTEARLTTSRGCNYQCTFCIDAMRYGRRWYARSASQVVEEIERLHRCLGIQHFWMSDDNFVTGAQVSRRRAEAIADGLIERKLDITYRARFRSDTFLNDPALLAKLADSGLLSAYVGLEAGGQEQLERFKKNTTVDQHKRMVADLRRNGIALQIGFIMFEPYASFGDIRASAAFLRDIGEMYIVGNFIQSLDVFPGAGITEMLRKDGLISPSFGALSNYDAYRFRDPDLGRMAAYMEVCHDEETITRDKWIHRCRTTLLPKLMRRLRRMGRHEAIARWQAGEDAIVTALNDANLAFFLGAADAFSKGQGEEAVDGLRRHAWRVQTEALEQYRALCLDIEKSMAPGPAGTVAVPGAGAGISTPAGSPLIGGGISGPLAEALACLADDARPVSVFGGGHLNTVLRVDAGDGRYVFRMRKDGYRALIHDYLGQLYGAAGFAEAGAFFDFRTIGEELAFIGQLRAAKVNVPRVRAAGTEWFVYDFVPGVTVASALADGGSPAIVLRLLHQLRLVHKAGLVCGDRWGSNEIVDDRGQVHLLDFDLRWSGDNHRFLAAAEMAVALFGALLAAKRRRDVIAFLEHFGIPELVNWGYGMDAMARVLSGYRDFCLDPHKPVLPLSPPDSVYHALAPDLERVIAMVRRYAGEGAFP